MYARLAFFALCLHLPAKAVEPDARCVFYIKIVANTLNGLWRPGDTLVGDQLFLYESPNGAVIVKRHEGDHTLSGKAGPADTNFGLGEPYSAELRAAFKAADLHNFDFEKQLAAAKTRQHLLEPNHGFGFVVGGKTVEVYANWEGTDFHFTCKDLGFTLSFFSAFNPELARLRHLLDQIGTFQTRRYTFTD